MTTLGLVIIALMALNAMRANRTVMARGALALGIMIAIAPYTPWPARILVENLQRPFIPITPIAWSTSNVIIVLGAGLDSPTTDRIEANPFSRSRALAAAITYHSCRLESSHCIVIVSGGDPNHTGVTEASRIAALLIQLGIPQVDIKTETASRNTFTNAQNSSALIREKYSTGKIFLITSSLHMKRSLLYFLHFGLSPNPIISDWAYPKWGLKSMTYNALLTDMVMAEYLGIGRYYIYNVLGWNPPRKLPTAIL